MPGNRLSRQWVVYLIRCSDESLYCGITNDLKNRLAAHNSGSGAKYTRSRRPVELVGASSEMTQSDALKLEYRVKQLPAAKKNLELSTGKFQITMGLKKDLQAVCKALEVLVDKTESLLKVVAKLENQKLEKH
ncbi:MAG: GIY-YIG nuclease family protein [Deltaproteobacteria bacterium]|nr:GIY-YIG nuclease family protein [Deltaproteobacteria bacterium]MBW2157009.1 GIY-YIG nuclease family protein [Deltaproteobacteria bacterium]MBW2198427.1 GIY-YIG nuclease family protein [Deltaproteobacteria bacterium]MBW2326906.1 GIY-YIG nuclease family protein [Deltaproteobacteria bacterium]